jgi:hypothetical protein
MTKDEGKAIDLKGSLARDQDFVRAAIEALVQAALERPVIPKSWASFIDRALARMVASAPLPREPA